MVSKKYTAIFISKEKKRILDRLKKELGAKTYDELIDILAKMVEECRFFRAKVMLCMKFKIWKATLPGWYKLFSMHGIPPELGFAYLKPAGDDDYTINIEKCEEDIKTT